ncbi:transposase [Bifidobacterium ramosum]|uniref:Transposase n=2 Tax=Bifidobacterium ramosum TaxID=1798158 RepID=A0A6L4X175_9BIFI|nr:transposase [Bifidobacterium ramosum]
MKRCCEWTIYMLTAEPDPASFVTAAHWAATGRKPVGDDEPVPGTATMVQLPAEGIDAYEGGFGIRTGWAGRPC